MGDFIGSKRESPNVLAASGRSISDRSVSSVSGGFSPTWHTVKHAPKKLIYVVERMLSKSRRERSATMIRSTKGEASVVVGPVIGKVTDTMARVLIEIDKTACITMQLVEATDGVENTRCSTNDHSARQVKEDWTGSNDHSGRQVNEDWSGHHSSMAESKSMEAGRPSVFVFQNLKPNTFYQVQLMHCVSNVPSCFSTFPTVAPTTLNIAVISCNKIFATQTAIPTHSDLWAHLAKAVESRSIAMLLHLGDQIYGDGDKLLDADPGTDPQDLSDCFRKSKRYLDRISSGCWKEFEGTICEYYREVYRKTWRHPYTAKCLANCSNLMIYDDHEIRDNWGDLESDRDKNSVDYFIASCAWKVNLEYQRQLYEDVDFTQSELINKDFHFHDMAGLGIMFLDIRGTRTFHRVEKDEKPYLGTLQWKAIKEALRSGGIFDRTRVLLVCTPAPLVFLEHNLTDAASNVPRLVDFKGHWSAAAHCKEQKEMMQCLYEWKSLVNDRVVLVLGGDVHCGGHSEILRDNQVIFRQLTTSAIANQSLPKAAYYFVRFAEQLHLRQGQFSYRHHDWTRSRNYGLLQIKHHGPEAMTFRPEVSAQLIKGKFMVGIRQGVQVSSLDGRHSRLKCFGSSFHC